MCAPCIRGVAGAEKLHFNPLSDRVTCPLPTRHRAARMPIQSVKRMWRPRGAAFARASAIVYYKHYVTVPERECKGMHREQEGLREAVVGDAVHREGASVPAPCPYPRFSQKTL